MVIRDLGIVGNAFYVRLTARAMKKSNLLADNANDLTHSAFHIICDKLAVCTGISQELLFVEGLHQLKGLLRGEAVIAVSLSLQGGQIV